MSDGEGVVGFAGEGLPGEGGVFEGHVAAGGAVFGDGDGTGVQIEVALTERLPRRDVRVPVQQDIAGAQGRQVRGVEDVAVRGIDEAVCSREHAVIGEDREGQHHLVDLRVAVAAHAEDLIPPLVQHGQHLLGRVFVRQIVARAMVEDVAQQEQAVRPLSVKGVEQRAAVAGRAVDIGCDHELHGISPFMRGPGRTRPSSRRARRRSASRRG